MSIRKKIYGNFTLGWSIVLNFQWQKVREWAIKNE